MHLTEKPEYSGLHKEGLIPLSCERLKRGWQSWDGMVALLSDALRDPGSSQLPALPPLGCASNFHGLSW